MSFIRRKSSKTSSSTVPAASGEDALNTDVVSDVLPPLLAPVCGVVADRTTNTAILAFVRETEIVTERIMLAEIAESTCDFRSIVCVTNDFGERTRQFPISEQERSLSDDQLRQVLIHAADNKLQSSERMPLFDAPLDDLAMDFTRNAARDLILTETPRASLTATFVEFFRSFASPVPTRVETRLRAMLRYHLTTLATAPSDPHTSPDAFLCLFAVSTTGFSIGFYQPARGIFSEFAELFFVEESEPLEPATVRPTAVQNEDSALDLISFSDIGDTSSYQSFQSDAAPTTTSQVREQSLHAVRLAQVEHAINRLALKLSPTKLSEYGVKQATTILFSASPEMLALVRDQLAFYSADTNQPMIETALSLEEAVSVGLVLGTVSESVSPLVPPINLNQDLRQRAAVYEDHLARQQRFSVSRERARAAFAVCVPFVVAGGVLVALFINTIITRGMLEMRQSRAMAESARLKPVTAARKSAVENFKWFETYIKQIVELRRRQPAVIALYHDLDVRYPVAADPTFFVQEVKTNTAGQIEIKGMTRNEAAATAFFRALEFSDTDSSGRKIFTGITLDTKKSNAPTPGAPGGVLLPPNTTTLNPSTGVVAWTIRGNYTPLAPVVQAAKTAAPNSATPPATGK